MLVYLFIVSKSSMHVVGTPYTWLYRLAALVWMVKPVMVRCWAIQPPFPRASSLPVCHLQEFHACCGLTVNTKYTQNWQSPTVIVCHKVCLFLKTVYVVSYHIVTAATYFHSSQGNPAVTVCHNFLFVLRLYT